MISTIKTNIKKHIPNKYLYKRELSIYNKRMNLTFAEAEKEIEKKYEITFGRKINWENPTTYNEKINVSKLYNSSKLKSELTDKISVTNWVKKQIGDSCQFIPLLGFYDSIADIDFSILPEKYVLKMNNDSGSVFICDKEHPITATIIDKYKYFYQNRDYTYIGFEMQYKDIPPKVMVEKYMGGSIRDYKFLCFNGKACCCWVDFDRFRDHKRNFYDKNWRLLPFNARGLSNAPDFIEEPRNYKKMWQLAEKLSSCFDQVRVDFYDIDNVIYFGEMTFTDGSGFIKYSPDKIDFELGEKWDLEVENINMKRRELLDSNLKICRFENK